MALRWRAIENRASKAVDGDQGRCLPEVMYVPRDEKEKAMQAQVGEELSSVYLKISRDTGGDH
jgi:hypothetical protein